MSKYFDPDSYTLENQLNDMLRYGDVSTSDDGVIIKDKGDHAEVIIPADNEKKHATYDYYYDGHVVEHKNN